MTEKIALRPAVQAFAEAMELEFRENDYKSRYKDLPLRSLLNILDVERQELQRYLSR